MEMNRGVKWSWLLPFGCSYRSFRTEYSGSALLAEALPLWVRAISLLFLVAVFQLFLSVSVFAQEANFDEQKFNDYVRQLGDDDFETRQKAQQALIEMGKPALDRLRKLEKEPPEQTGLNDLERRQRVEAAIQALHDRIPAGNGIDDTSLKELQARIESSDPRYKLNRGPEGTPFGTTYRLEGFDELIKNAFPFNPPGDVTGTAFEYDENGKLIKLKVTVKINGKEYNFEVTTKEGERDENGRSRVEWTGARVVNPELPLPLLSVLSTSMAGLLLQARNRRRWLLQGQNGSKMANAGPGVDG